MVRALSNDLRERVVAALGDGGSCRSVAARFAIMRQASSTASISPMMKPPPKK